MTLLLIFLFGAMAVSFLCSLLESVLMSTPISYISMKEEEGDRDAIRFSKLKDNPDRPLTAILALNTIANTIGAAGVGQQATLVFGSQWFGLVSALMTLLILIFSEIIPKTIGSYHWKNLLWLSRITPYPPASGQDAEKEQKDVRRFFHNGDAKLAKSGIKRYLCEIIEETSA